MRVLYIAHSSEIEGSGIALLNILKGVRNEGVEPFVILPREGPFLSYLDREGIRYCILKFLTSDYSTNTSLPKILYLFFAHFIINITAFLRIFLICKRRNIDIIHTNTGIVHLGFWVSLLLNKPHVWHLREYQLKDFNMRPYCGFGIFKKLLSQKNNKCIAITQGVFEEFKLDPQKDSVIYDGVASNAYTSIFQNKNDYFLFVGSLSENKGVLDLLNEYSSIANSVDTEMWLVGRDVIDVAKLIKERKLDDKVKYLGVRKDVYELMSKARALIVPSKFEGFGFITAEAMLNHCLVIGRNTAGTKEQFDNGREWTGTEIGIRFNNATELKEILLNVSKCSISNYSKTLESAYVSAKHYSIERNIECINNLYRKIWVNKHE